MKHLALVFKVVLPLILPCLLKWWWSVKIEAITKYDVVDKSVKASFKAKFWHYPELDLYVFHQDGNKIWPQSRLVRHDSASELLGVVDIGPPDGQDHYIVIAAISPDLRFAMDYFDQANFSHQQRSSNNKYWHPFQIQDKPPGYFELSRLIVPKTVQS